MGLFSGRSTSAREDIERVAGMIPLAGLAEGRGLTRQRIDRLTAPPDSPDSLPGKGIARAHVWARDELRAVRDMARRPKEPNRYYRYGNIVRDGATGTVVRCRWCWQARWRTWRFNRARRAR